MKYDAELLEATSIILRRLREKAGLSQEELAARTGVTRSMIDKMERRERLPSLDTLLKVSKTLNSSASEIVALIEKEVQR